MINKYKMIFNGIQITASIVSGLYQYTVPNENITDRGIENTIDCQPTYKMSRRLCEDNHKRNEGIYIKINI